MQDIHHDFSLLVARNDCVPCHGKNLMASAIALKTFADVQERGELYASIYLHVKRQDPAVRRLRVERIVLEDRQLGDGIADAAGSPWPLAMDQPVMVQ